MCGDEETCIEEGIASQVADNRPDMRLRALLDINIAAWSWNRILLTEPAVDIPRVAIVFSTAST